MTVYVEANSYSFKRGPNVGAVKTRVAFGQGMGDAVTLTIHEDDSLSIDLTAEDALTLASQIHDAVAAAIKHRQSELEELA